LTLYSLTTQAPFIFVSLRAIRPGGGEAISQVTVDISPFLVRSVDQIEFVLPGATFYLFLSNDGPFNIGTRFVIDELSEVILLRKTFGQSALVLKHSSFQVVGNARVQCSISGIGHYVDVIFLFQFIQTTSSSSMSLRAIRRGRRRSNLIKAIRLLRRPSHKGKDSSQ
jgi:hypothetical protein